MLGIIGGSGLEKLDLFKESKSVKVDSKYGVHSPIKTGLINGIEVAIMSRHGYSHEIPPSKINYRANIWAMKELGVDRIIASSACGSLKEVIEPGHLVLPDQFIDRTWNRNVTFFDENEVSHVAMAEPFCASLRKIFMNKSKELGLKIHNNKTLLVIEGPRFSTRAESKMYISWGADVINMTTIPEVVLAKELNIPYQVICMATDYDAWHNEREAVSFEMVLEVMKKNANNVVSLFVESLKDIDSCDLSNCK